MANYKGTVNTKEKLLKIVKKCEKNKDVIIDEYVNKEFSIFELCKKYNLHRSRIEKILSDANIQKRNVYNMHTKRSRRKAKETFIKKYGVDNISKLETQKERMRVLNKNGYKVEGNYRQKKDWMSYIFGMQIHPMLEKEFTLYKNKVLLISKKEKKYVPFTGKCYYTNVDIFNDKKMFNNDRYASIDHRISILRGFEDGFSAEEIGDRTNLCYCSRLCNSVKREDDEKTFIQSGKLKRLIEYESQKSE